MLSGQKSLNLLWMWAIDQEDRIHALVLVLTICTPVVRGPFSGCIYLTIIFLSINLSMK